MNILIIGGANMDIKCHIEGAVVAGSSNPGHIRLSVGGVGRNIAHNLALLGCETHLLTALGDDAHGGMLRNSCAQAGIHLHAQSGLWPTGTYTAILDATGDLVIGVAAMQAIDALKPETLAVALAHLSNVECLVADANLPEETLLFLAQWAEHHAVSFVFEPVSVAKCTRILPILGHWPVYLMSPNRAQLDTLTARAIDSADDLPRACAALHARGVENIIVGLGSDGAFWSDGQSSGTVPACAHEIIDATGGGDAALAAALWALKRGAPLPVAAQAGQKAAALTVACTGSVNPTLSADTLKHEVP